MANYRGEGLQRRDCDGLAAHYQQIQAICDAMSHAAQIDQASALERDDQGAADRAYGAWLAMRGLLRVIEGLDTAAADPLGNLHTDLTDTEKEMLRIIDWTRETFMFPGREKFEGVVQHLPGEEPA